MSSSRASSRTSSAASSGSSDARREKAARKVQAQLDELDSYMEKLYDEDIESKLEGARMILQLAEYAGNIESLVQNESLMVRQGALSVFSLELTMGSTR
ncbi:hypothetical protein PINS_up015588 [Pythium insidiosum]|nr:hypothetical protein PINS_up015588 [Pythium insidiosum]